MERNDRVAEVFSVPKGNLVLELSDSTIIRLTQSIGYGLDESHIESDVEFVVDLNEVTASTIPFWECSWDEDEKETVGVFDVDMAYSGDAAFIVSKFENLPYAGFYGATEEGSVYEFSRFLTQPEDELIDVQETGEKDPFLIKNVETGVTKVVSYDEVTELFSDDGPLDGAVKVH
jgi:hypothetical protein